MIILTTRIDGLMKYQHAFQYSQKKKLLLPTIISTSSAKRFPPAKGVRNTVDGSQIQSSTWREKTEQTYENWSIKELLNVSAGLCTSQMSIKSVSNPQGTSFYNLYLVAWHRRLTQLQEGGGLRWWIGNFPFWPYHRRRWSQWPPRDK